MERKRKITARLSAALLAKAQDATGKGISETIRLGLEMMIIAKASEELRLLRGKVALSPAIGRKTKQLTTKQKAALSRIRKRASQGWTLDGEPFDRASLHER